jgi:NAD(P)-dependent dehydrogenase (short-subunit alcohol dehydrogenase family)
LTEEGRTPPAGPDDQTGSAVLLTGGNEGIGYHLTKSLLESGHRVAVVDLNDSNLDALAGAFPDRLMVIRADVTSDEQVAGAVQTVLSAWGSIDVVVNNACLARFARFEDRTPEDIRREFEVNYFGYLRVIAAVLPSMKARGKGVIHNVSSGVGLSGFPGIVGYASTKGAIEAMTRTLAIEFEPYGIRVNLIHPPLTNTKSAAPLGIPPQMMADPAAVGRKLARKIGSTKAVITPDLSAGLGLAMMRLFPGAFGRLLGKAAARARDSREGGVGHRGSEGGAGSPD